MRIDAHQHYWKIARGDYGWLSPGVPVLYRDFLPRHLRTHLQEHHYDGTILIQAAPTLEETDYLLSLGDHDDDILGVVGWLNLTDPAYQEHFTNFNRHPKFVGFRIMIQDMENPDKVLQDNFIGALTYFADRDVPVDLLVTHDQLPILIELLNKVPNLRGVVDHLAKPPIASGNLEPWKNQIKEVAQHSSIYCKLSGMETEADHEQWKIEDFMPYVHHVVNVFGAERVMYGSDWPVCLNAASYEEVNRLLNHCLPENLTDREKTKLFGENARIFYKL